MAIDTFTIKFNEYELETILAAMDDYRHYDDEGMDPEDLIGRTPVLARVNAIEDNNTLWNYSFLLAAAMLYMLQAWRLQQR